MNTRVLRILALRALPLLVVVLLFLVLAWFALPSPHLTDDGVTFPTSTLQSGNVLTRVYAVNDFFPFWDNSPPVVHARRHDREYFSLDFSISSPPTSLKFSPHHNVSLDFGKHTEDGTMTISSEEIYGPARMGDLDGINAPWFPVADATLLFWQIHQESVDLLLRVRYGQGRIEIWPATAQWDQKAPGDTPSYLTPLLILELIPSEHDDHHIIATTPRPPISSSPSSTYPLRVGIITILLILYFTFNLISYPIGIALGLLWNVIKFAVQITGLLGLLLFVIWWWKGRPPLEEIRESVAGVLGRTTEALHPPRGMSSSGAGRRSGEQVRKMRAAGELDLEAGNPPLDECDIGVRGSS